MYCAYSKRTIVGGFKNVDKKGKGSWMDKVLSWLTKHAEDEVYVSFSETTRENALHPYRCFILAISENHLNFLSEHFMFFFTLSLIEKILGTVGHYGQPNRRTPTETLKWFPNSQIT